MAKARLNFLVEAGATVTLATWGNTRGQGAVNGAALACALVAGPGESISLHVRIVCSDASVRARLKDSLQLLVVDARIFTSFEHLLLESRGLQKL